MARNGFHRERGALDRFDLVACPRRRFRPGEQRPRLPWQDHVYVWRKTRVGTLFTSQPYGYGSDVEKLLAMRKVCDLYGVEMVASKEMSWWHPGTTLIVVGKRETLEAAELQIDASAPWQREERA
jgi:hypothetical protein